MSRIPIQTSDAPAAIGVYSQAIQTDSLIFLSGQIPLDPATMELVGSDMRTQITQVFNNLEAVAKAAGAGLDDCLKLTVYLVDLKHFSLVNEIMATYFSQPYPARAAIGVAALPKGAMVEMDAILTRRD